MPPAWTARHLGAPLGRDLSAAELLRRPEVWYEALLELAGPPAALADARLPAQVRTQIEVHAKLRRLHRAAQEEIERTRRHEETALPSDLDYHSLQGLSHEVRQKLARCRPATLGQAARLPGVTPAAVSILLVHLKKRAHGAPQVA